MSDEMGDVLWGDGRRAGQEEGWNDAIEAAARVADAPLEHRKGPPGAWRQRRAKIAAAIRALAKP